MGVMGKRLEFLFAGEQPDLTFVEVEDGNGHSIRAGEWIKRGEFSVLVLDENAEIARLRADLAEAGADAAKHERSADAFLRRYRAAKDAMTPEASGFLGDYKALNVAVGAATAERDIARRERNDARSDARRQHLGAVMAAARARELGAVARMLLAGECPVCGRIVVRDPDGVWRCIGVLGNHPDPCGYTRTATELLAEIGGE